MNRRFAIQQHRCSRCDHVLAFPVAAPGAVGETFFCLDSRRPVHFAWTKESFPFQARIAALVSEPALRRWLLAEIADPVFSGPLDPYPRCPDCGADTFEPAGDPEPKLEWVREATFEQASRLSDEELLAECARIRTALGHAPPSPQFLDGTARSAVRTLTNCSEPELRAMAEDTLRQDWLAPDGVALRQGHHLLKFLEILESEADLVVCKDLQPGLADSYAFVSVAEADESFSRRWLSGVRANGRPPVGLRGTGLVVSKFLPVACTDGVFLAMARRNPPFRVVPCNSRLFGLCHRLEEAAAQAGIRLCGVTELAALLPFEIPGWESNQGQGRIFDLLFWDTD